jgi:hypothetical protein
MSFIIIHKQMTQNVTLYLYAIWHSGLSIKKTLSRTKIPRTVSQIERPEFNSPLMYSWMLFNFWTVFRRYLNFATCYEASPAHTSSYTMGTGSLPRVKRSGRVVDHSSLSTAEVKERGELYPYSPSGPSWSILGWTLLLYATNLHLI